MGEGLEVAGEGTRFKKGNSAASGADHRLDGLLRSKRFKEKCRDFLLNESNGVEVGSEVGGFAILKQVAIGYKGVKPADRLAALTLMAKVAGELKENITVERVDPLQEVSKEELLEMAQQSLKVIEAKRVGEDGRDGEIKAGDGGVKAPGD